MLFAAAGAALLATPLHARETAWMGVGTRTVTAEAVSQTIEVRGVNVPRETMFCSDGASVQIVSAEFRYRTGDAQTLTLRARVRAGDCSTSSASASRSCAASHRHWRTAIERPGWR